MNNVSMKFNRGYFKKTIDGWSCVAAIIFVEKENVITQSGAAAQRNLTNECNMPMKFNGRIF